MSSEWIMNDLKVEKLALKMKFLREQYFEKNPNASQEQTESYINKKLSKESNSVLQEQFQIISKSGL